MKPGEIPGPESEATQATTEHSKLIDRLQAENDPRYPTFFQFNKPPQSPNETDPRIILFRTPLSNIAVNSSPTDSYVILTEEGWYAVNNISMSVGGYSNMENVIKEILKGYEPFSADVKGGHLNLSTKAPNGDFKQASFEILNRGKKITQSSESNISVNVYKKSREIANQEKEKKEALQPTIKLNEYLDQQVSASPQSS